MLALSLGADHLTGQQCLGIYFYLRVIQLMFMSAAATDTTDATGAAAVTVVAEGKARRLAVGASLACLAAALLVSVFPGWVMALF